MSHHFPNHKYWTRCKHSRQVTSCLLHNSHQHRWKGLSAQCLLKKFVTSNHRLANSPGTHGHSSHTALVHGSVPIWDDDWTTNDTLSAPPLPAWRSKPSHGRCVLPLRGSLAGSPLSNIQLSPIAARKKCRWSANVLWEESFINQVGKWVKYYLFMEPSVNIQWAQKGLSHNFQTQWAGSYEIVDKISPLSSQL